MLGDGFTESVQDAVKIAQVVKPRVIDKDEKRGRFTLSLQSEVRALIYVSTSLVVHVNTLTEHVAGRTR